MIGALSPTDLHDPEPGTIWGPLGALDAEMSAEGVAGIDDGLGIRMQIALCGGERPVSGDLPQDVDRHTGVGHPGKARMPEIVSPEML